MPKMNQEEQNKKKKALLLTALVTADLVLLIFITYHLAYWGRIYPGVRVASQPVGNLKLDQAVQRLNQKLSVLGPLKILLVYDGQEWEIDLSELNFAYQPTHSAQKAYRVGRSGSLVENIATKIKTWKKGADFKMEYTLDRDQLEARVATIAAEIFIPTVEPSIKIAQQQIQVEPGKKGREVDKPRLLSAINNQLSRPEVGPPLAEAINLNPIEIPMTQTPPIVSKIQLENTRYRAEKLLGKKLILTHEATEWEFGEEELIQLISFTDDFDQKKIASWSAQLAEAVNRPPQNAAFQFENNQVKEFRPAKEGKTLGQRRAIQLIAQGLVELKTKPSVTINLPVMATPPEIKTAEVNNLGIKELVGQGVSYFRGSISSRIHNIQLASSRLNGQLIAPGKVFSFNQSLGDVSKATGYKEAYIIKAGRTVLGDGGGVCQVSTTFFRAALDAGLPIVERRAHAYRVSYYEQESPVGLDATVFAPTVDLKIKNDTPAYLLVQTRVDLKEKKLVFDFYGSHDGRTTNLSKSRIWDQVPPPPDLYQDDPTLPTGIIKQVDWKAWGAKTAFDYQVEREGQILQERTFYSAYRPWQAVFLRGTAPAQ